MRTSSPASTPATCSAICSAAVPFTVATPDRAPTKLATAFSNRSTKGPTEETHPVSRHSLTYFHSLPRISGTDNGITFVSVGGIILDREFMGAVPGQVLLHPLDCKLQTLFQGDMGFPT